MKGTKTIDVEIYDECTFTNDAMVAHSTLPLPEDVFKHVVVDEWFPLSGQEGHEKEGVLHLILSLQPIRQTHGPPMVTSAQGQAQPKIPTDEQLTDLNKMFPNLDKDIILMRTKWNLVHNKKLNLLRAYFRHRKVEH